MSHYFIESKYPLCVNISQVICNPESDLDSVSLINKFDEHFEKEQHENWLKFWNSQGEELVLQIWNNTYKDYFEVDEKEKKQEEDKETEVSAAYERSWEDLWQELIAEVYYEQYLAFTSIYYNYFVHLKKSCETETTDPELLTDEEEEKDLQSDIEQVQQELEQLKILGLPISFGGRPQNSGRRHKTCRNSIEQKGEHINDFFTDSEILTESSESDQTDASDMEDCQINEKKEGSSINAPAKLSGKVKKRKRNRKMKNVPSFILEEKGLLKYWHKRFSLFSRFNEGIRLDRESWFSVTPEKVAIHLAERLKCDTVIDGFCGSGGNAIQLALTCNKVIAIDIDPIKIEMAKHNAQIYQVAHKIDFILGDFLQLAAGGKLKADVVFLSPPWGGPKYKNKKDFDIETSLQPVKASELMEASRNISQNIALFLPRNSNVKQIIKLAGAGKRCEIEQNYLDSRLVAITALYGDGILNENDEN